MPLAVVWAAGAYVAWLYLSAALKATLPTSIFETIGKTLFGATAALVLYFGGRRVVALMRVPMSVSAIAVLWAMVGSVVSDQAWTQAGRVVVVVLVFLAFAALGDDAGALRAILPVLACLAVVNALVGIWGAVTHQALLPREAVGVGTMGFDDTTGRSGGFQGENYVGVWCAPALAVGLEYLRQERTRVLGFGLVASAMFATVVSLSRTSALSVAAVVAVWLWGLPKRRTTLAMLVSFAALVTILSQFGRELVEKQLSGYQAFEREQRARWTEFETVSDRREIWRSVIEAGLKRPLVGNGPEASFRLFGVQGHNAFLDVFVDYGIVGAAMFLCFPVYVMLAAVRRRGRMSADSALTVLGGLWLAGLVCWLTLSSAFSNIIWVYNGLLYGRLAGSKGRWRNSIARGPGRAGGVSRTVARCDVSALGGRTLGGGRL